MESLVVYGAASGGTNGFGMVYRVHGESMNEKMFAAAELHDHIKDEYGSTCCRVITRQWAGDNFQSPERKEHCIEIIVVKLQVRVAES